MDSFLATGTFLPIGFLYFVTTHVYIFIREEIEYLFKDVLTEFESSIFPRTDRRRKGFPPTNQPVTSEIGILGDGSQEMSRHIYFRNYINSSLRSIIHNFLDIFVCIVTTVQGIPFHNPYLIFRNQEVGVILFYCTFHTTTIMFIELPPRSLFRQQRVFLDFDPPSLIIRQVPMELI